VGSGHEQWFYRVTEPDFRVVSATVRPEGREFVVEFTADNAGAGKISVTVEALRGSPTGGTAFDTAEVQLLVGQGAETKGLIRCSFRPQKLVLDRMYETIDVDRSNNEYRF
jgi:hypothetical protein